MNDNFAQSTFEKIEKLALRCNKGHTKSCNALEYIAMNDMSEYVREEAIKSIEDQDVLASIAINSVHSREIGSCGSAAKKISNEKALIKVV